jgi:hypothetical protein
LNASPSPSLNASNTTADQTISSLKLTEQLLKDKTYQSYMDNTKQIIKTIADEIKYKRNDNFLNHLKTYLQFDRLHFSGTFTDNSFTIWRYQNWSGLFYLVVYGHIVFEGNQTKVNLKTKLNIVGLLLALAIFIAFFLGITGFKITGLTVREFFLALFFSMLAVIVFLSLSHRQFWKYC